MMVSFPKTRFLPLLSILLFTLNARADVGLAMAILEKTPTGRAVLEDARRNNLSITDGKISKTEIIATRVIQGEVETLDYHVQVLISKDKHPVFQAIDLAHELAHALHPKSNPFDPKLNAVDYIRQGIEATGGEAHAIRQECKVGRELVSIVEQEQGQLIKARCQYVWKTESDPARWKLSFYHLGNQYDHFVLKLRSMNTDQRKKNEMTDMVQSKDPMFTSAAANKPYPLALLDEYMEITKKICKKSTQRKVEFKKSGVAMANISQMDERCQSLSSALFSP